MSTIRFGKRPLVCGLFLRFRLKNSAGAGICWQLLFRTLNFDPASHYEHSLGITRPDEESPAKIELSLEPTQGQYLMTFPLHASQQGLQSTDALVRLQLNVYNTHDLLLELLSLGDWYG